MSPILHIPTTSLLFQHLSLFGIFFLSQKMKNTHFFSPAQHTPSLPHCCPDTFTLQTKQNTQDTGKC